MDELQIHSNFYFRRLEKLRASFQTKYTSFGLPVHLTNNGFTGNTSRPTPSYNQHRFQAALIDAKIFVQEKKKRRKGSNILQMETCLNIVM